MRQAISPRIDRAWNFSAYRSHFVFADLTARPVQQFQVLIQRFPQTTVHPVPCYHLGVDSVASCDCYNLGGGPAMT